MAAGSAAPRNVYVAESRIAGAGRGVFAARDLTVGEVVEVCPVVLVPLDDVARSVLLDYFFDFGDRLAVVLGYGFLYNHSYEPTATYFKSREAQTVTFYAVAEIRVGDEITVNYNGGSPGSRLRPAQSGVPPFEAGPPDARDTLAP